MDIEKIYDFLQERCGAEREGLSPSTDLAKYLKMRRRDFRQLEEEFEERFQVDMESFLWYYHSPLVRRRLYIVTDMRWGCRRIPYVPITPTVLLQAAKDGVWLYTYPPQSALRWFMTTRAGWYFPLLSWILAGMAILYVLFKAVLDSFD